MTSEPTGASKGRTSNDCADATVVVWATTDIENSMQKRQSAHHLTDRGFGHVFSAARRLVGRYAWNKNL